MGNVTDRILLNPLANRPLAWIGILPIEYDSATAATMPFLAIIDTGFDGYMMLPQRCFQQICTYEYNKNSIKKYIYKDTKDSRVKTNRGEGTAYCANAWLYAETSNNRPQTQKGVKVIYKHRPLIVLDPEPSQNLTRPLIGMDFLMNGSLNFSLHLSSEPYYAQVKK